MLLWAVKWYIKQTKNGAANSCSFFAFRKELIIIAVVKQLMVRAGADFSSMRKQMQKAQETVSSFANNVGKTLKRIGLLFAGIFAVKKMVEFGKASKQAADDMSLHEAKLAVIMRTRMRATDETIDSVKNLIAAQEGIGVVDAGSQTAAAQELATYLSSADSLKTLIPTLNDLVAQQYGLSASAEQATGMATMLGKVMDGQVGALSRYGFTFDAAQEKILKYGSEASRAALLVDIVRDSIGDMNAELGKTPQGQWKQIIYTFDAIKVEIGKGLTPVLQQLLPYIRAVANALLRAAQFATAFVNALFGVKKQNNAVTQQVASIGDVADAYDDAGEAAKKASKSVAGFDEVNTLGSGNGDSSVGEYVGSGGGIDLGLNDESVSGASEAMTKLSEKAQEMAEKVKTAYGAMKDFIVANKEPIIAALGGIAVALGSLVIANTAASALNLLKVAFGALLSPVGLVVAAIAAIAAGFIYMYRNNEDFRNGVNEAWAKIREVISSFWENVLKPFGAWLLENLPKAWAAVSDAAKRLWDNVLKPFGSWLGNVLVKAWEGVTIAAEWLWKNVLVPFGNFLEKLWKTVIAPLAEIIGDVLATAFKIVADIAKSFWKNVLVPLGEFFKDILKPVIDAVAAVFTSFWQYALVPLGKFITDRLVPFFEALVIIIEYLWKSVLKPLVGFVGGILLSVFDTTFKTIGEIINGVKKIFIGLMDFITGVFTDDWGKAWKGIKDIFEGIVSTLYSVFKYPMNMIIDMINTVINGLNSISIDVPDWVPGYGGRTFGINIPKIPRLAKGGITNGEMVAMIGDNPGGREVVSPLDDLVSIVKTAVSSAMSAMGGNDKQGDINLQIDGVTFARITNAYNAKESTRIGRSMITVT